MRQGEDVCRIVAAGDFSPEHYRAYAGTHPAALLIAADAGYRYLHRLGVEPDLFVGDTDSLGFRPDGMPCVLLPSVKDDTDTISALREGLKRGFRRFEIFGALGGKRLSHSLANLQALLFLKERQADGVLIDEHCTVCALCGSGDRRTVAPNRFFSLFAATESAVVSIADAKYPLERHRLTSAFPLGASNESAAVPATVTLVDGSVFLVIEPK